MSAAPTVQPTGSPGAGGRMTGRTAARYAALCALLNTFLRETGQHDPRVAPEDPRFLVRLSATGQMLSGLIKHWSPMGHHVYGRKFTLWALNADMPYEASYRELVEVLVTEALAAAVELVDVPAEDSRAVRTLVGQIDDSVRRTRRYLDRERPDRPTAPWELTRYAEQSICLGHPMHPTPKTAEGFTDQDVAAYAPELGARFALHYLAIAPELVREERIAPAEWIPEAVSRAAVDLLGPHRDTYRLLPVHPWQAGYLSDRPVFRNRVDEGALVALGPLGEPVYATSSVRTVCDPAFPTAWKLPLHVRITNFLRTNPGDHVRRAADASRVIDALRPDWGYDGFEVLVETGYRTVRDPELAAEMSVLFRENPFAASASAFAPQVVAALLEQRPGVEPDLAGYLRQAAGTGPADRRVGADVVVEWLRRYLAVGVLPVLALWTDHGVSLEAHAQNSMVHLEDGWPARCYVRDMEGVSVSRRARVVRDVVPTGSPLLYDEDQAWLRLKYYLVTNHLGHLVHVLSRCGAAEERQLWGVVADVLAERARGAGRRGGHLVDLLRAPTLPAKANLLSRLAHRSETPLYVRVRNPMNGVAR